MFEAIARWWCAFWHDDDMWPVNGEIKCRQCHLVRSIPHEIEAMRTTTEKVGI